MPGLDEPEMNLGGYLCSHFQRRHLSGRLEAPDTGLIYVSSGDGATGKAGERNEYWTVTAWRAGYLSAWRTESGKETRHGGVSDLFETQA